MTRTILGFFAVLMYGSLAMAAGVDETEAAQKQGGISTADDNRTTLGGISDDERERRVQVCEREWEF